MYELDGPQFFATTADFLSQFTPAEDTDEVVIDYARAKVMDHSAGEAIDSLAERYRKAGKRLHLRHQTPDGLELLTKAKERVEIDVREEPHYPIDCG